MNINNVHIVIINGIGGSGKSTFVQECIKYSDDKRRIYEFSTVDYVKKIARVCGWNGEKEERDRKFLSDLKFALADWRDLPIKYVFDEIEEEIEKYKFTDTRFIFFINSREQKDHIKISQMAEERGFSVERLLINRPNFISTEPKEIVDKVHDCTYDTVIGNRGDLVDLQNAALQFLVLKKFL